MNKDLREREWSRRRFLRLLLKRRAKLQKIVTLEAAKRGRLADLTVCDRRLVLKSFMLDENHIPCNPHVTDLTHYGGRFLWKKMKQHFERAPT